MIPVQTINVCIDLADLPDLFIAFPTRSMLPQSYRLELQVAVEEKAVVCDSVVNGLKKVIIRTGRFFPAPKCPPLSGFDGTDVAFCSGLL